MNSLNREEEGGKKLKYRLSFSTTNINCLIIKDSSNKLNNFLISKSKSHGQIDKLLDDYESFHYNQENDEEEEEEQENKIDFFQNVLTFENKENLIPNKKTYEQANPIEKIFQTNKNFLESKENKLDNEFFPDVLNIIEVFNLFIKIYSMPQEVSFHMEPLDFEKFKNSLLCKSNDKKENEYYNKVVKCLVYYLVEVEGFFEEFQIFGIELNNFWQQLISDDSNLGEVCFIIIKFMNEYNFEKMKTKFLEKCSVFNKDLNEDHTLIDQLEIELETSEQGLASLSPISKVRMCTKIIEILIVYGQKYREKLEKNESELFDLNLKYKQYNVELNNKRNYYFYLMNNNSSPLLLEETNFHIENLENKMMACSKALDKKRSEHKKFNRFKPLGSLELNGTNMNLSSMCDMLFFWYFEEALPKYLVIEKRSINSELTVDSKWFQIADLNNLTILSDYFEKNQGYSKAIPKALKKIISLNKINLDENNNETDLFTATNTDSICFNSNLINDAGILNQSEEISLTVPEMALEVEVVTNEKISQFDILNYDVDLLKASLNTALLKFKLKLIKSNFINYEIEVDDENSVKNFKLSDMSAWNFLNNNEIQSLRELLLSCYFLVKNNFIGSKFRQNNLADIWIDCVNNSKTMNRLKLLLFFLHENIKWNYSCEDHYCQICNQNFEKLEKKHVLEVPERYVKQKCFNCGICYHLSCFLKYKFSAKNEENENEKIDLIKSKKFSRILCWKCNRQEKLDAAEKTKKIQEIEQLNSIDVNFHSLRLNKNRINNIQNKLALEDIEKSNRKSRKTRSKRIYSSEDSSMEDVKKKKKKNDNNDRDDDDSDETDYDYVFESRAKKSRIEPEIFVKRELRKKNESASSRLKKICLEENKIDEDNEEELIYFEPIIRNVIISNEISSEKTIKKTNLEKEVNKRELRRKLPEKKNHSDIVDTEKFRRSDRLRSKKY